MDIESRRNDAREAAVEAVRRLETTWQLFKDLEPKMVVNDEQIFRELKDRFGSAVRLRRLLPAAAWARSRSASCSRAST